MKTKYISGGAAILFGGFLLGYLIPNFVTASEGVMSPTLFPTIAAWMFILLGVIQMLTPDEPLDLPSTREFVRTAALALIVLIAVFAMEWLGFLIASIAFMAVIAGFMHERRPIWLIATIALTPIGIWLVFELLLRRPLPAFQF